MGRCSREAKKMSTILTEMGSKNSEFHGRNSETNVELAG